MRFPRIFSFVKKSDSSNDYKLYFYQSGKPVWMARDYQRFADEGYIRNVIAFRSIQMIASGAASVGFRLHRRTRAGAMETLKAHPILTLLHRPNPCQGGAALFESLFTSRLVSGNAYLQAIGGAHESPRELHALRPDRVMVLTGKSCVPAGYRYSVGNKHIDFPVDRLSGRCQLLHLKTHHPLNDWYGLSPIEAAAYAIDQHNQAGQWNQSLLQNGARPSGALMVKAASDGSGGFLSEDQYTRLKRQLEENYSGAAQAGRPLLLEGGLEWKELGLSPKDMDFLETKHTAARDIALAFGVPPQLLGIAGDNTYNNYKEARLALWEDTILPLVDHVIDELNNWLIPMFGNAKLVLSYDRDSISALSPRREAMWNRVAGAEFLSEEEKRELLGV